VPARWTPGARFVASACRDDADWQLLAAEIGRPDLAGDRALGTAAGRCGRAGELDAAVAAWTVTQPAERVERRLQDAGVPAHVSSSSRISAPTRSWPTAGTLVRLPIRCTAAPPSKAQGTCLSDTPGRVTRAAPLLGQDNEYVLTSSSLRTLTGSQR